jgi:hypothetical protein
MIAASATAGTLLGFGIHLGTPARPFNAIAALALGPGAQAVYGFSPLPTLLGILLHVAAMIAWGVVYELLVARTRGYLTASLVVAVAALTALLLPSRLFGVGPAALLSIGNLVALSVVLAVALPLGMRLAPSEV